ncbi:MAG: hypothetical protein JW969_03475 [Spirochaetales bacterium]|nr:hypothetical protein [Spirochaetales bacterium]
MGKVSEEARRRFVAKSKEYKQKIGSISEKIKKSGITFKKSDLTVNYKRLELADDELNLVSYQVLLNTLSISLLGVKNESYLNEGRKGLYRAIILLEDTVSDYIDVPFSEYEERLVSIAQYDDVKRYYLVRKLGYSLQTVEDAYGTNSKWKWSFVELQGRYATICKNLIDLKSIVRNLDPRVEGYNERFSYLELTKKLLQKAADKYREKYELSTRRLDDMQLAINYLSALKRLLMVLNQKENIDVIKKKIDVWSLKMETDQKKKEGNKPS